MSSDEEVYGQVAKGSLKLKGLGGKIKKKKKKKAEAIEKVQVQRLPEDILKKTFPLDLQTKAEMAFDKAQLKRLQDKVLKRAEKSHKQRVEDFNKQLDSLTEHNDIPKVSWTK